jgi:hypothetical protein
MELLAARVGMSLIALHVLERARRCLGQSFAVAERGRVDWLGPIGIVPGR